MKTETLHTQEDILKMLDSLLRPAEPFWNDFMRIEKRMFRF